jgi:hypothetical protein
VQKSILVHFFDPKSGDKRKAKYNDGVSRKGDLQSPLLPPRWPLRGVLTQPACCVVMRSCLQHVAAAFSGQVHACAKEK